MTAPPPPSSAHDELTEQLSALPRHDVGALRAARGRAVARAAFVREHQRAERDWSARVGSFYTRFLEPAWVTALCLATLGWAFTQASAILVQ